MGESREKLVAGRYRLIEVLGAGGMGRVWRSHDELIDREVALKEILLPPGLDDERRDAIAQRAIREARAAGRLNHPGIVTVHDVVRHEGSPAIVMEFVRGGSLADAIAEQGALPPEQVAAIGAAMLAALRAAHAAGIVHRDLKPANVLLAEDRVVITDFGIASLAGDTELTQSGMILGTPTFMSPEQANGEQATAASDLWSLGATLYAAVEGRPPFDGPNVMAVLAALVTREPATPTRAGSLGLFLNALLCKDPAGRPTAEQAARLLADLEAGTGPGTSVGAGAPGALAMGPGPPSDTVPESGYPSPAPPMAPSPQAGNPPPDSPPGSPPAPPFGATTVPRTAGTTPTGGPTARRRALFLAGAAAFVSLSVPAVIWAFGEGDTKGKSPLPTATTAGQSQAGPGAAPGRSAEASGGPTEITDALRISDTGEIATVTFSPNGRLLAGADSDLKRSGGTARLWDTTSGRLLAALAAPPSPGGNSVQAVAFSPDGRLLATGGNSLDESTWLWRVSDRQRIGPLAQSRSIMKSLAFSPDSRTVAGVTHTGSITIWDVASRSPKVGLPDADGSRNVVFSGDGRLLANPGKGGDVRLSDPVTGRTVKTITDTTGSNVSFSPDGRTIAVPDSDGTRSLRLWDVASGTSVAFDRTDELVASLVFSPDGRTIATWNTGNVIQLWDVGTRRVRALLVGHSGRINSVAFNRDGSRVASSSRDGTIRVWKPSR